MSDLDLFAALMAGVDVIPLGQRYTKPKWMRDGACLEHPELSWFPARGVHTGPVVAICHGCLVRDECLEYALADPAMHGVWGGTSERERRRLKRAQPRPTRAQPAPKQRVTLPIPVATEGARQSGTGECSCCSRIASRRRRGLCPACYIRWLRAQHAA